MTSVLLVVNFFELIHQTVSLATTFHQDVVYFFALLKLQLMSSRHAFADLIKYKTME